MTAYQSFLAQKRFGSLDGLRALSIVAVIWHHTAPSWVSSTFALIGAQGVTLFFAISGFLITTLLLREQSKNGFIDLKAFYFRRSLRIFPLYFATLLLYIVLVWALERDTEAGRDFFNNLIYFATYTSNIFVPLNEGRNIFYFSWSLAAEEQFYLVLPSLLVLMASNKRTALALILVMTVCVILEETGNALMSVIPMAIITGAFLAIVLNNQRGYHVLAPVLARRWSVVVIAFLLAWALTSTWVPSYVTHIVFVLLVGACVMQEKHLASPFLTLKPVAYIGSISYGMYMLHMLSKNFTVTLLQFLTVSTDGLIVFFATLTVTVLVASVSFKYFEAYFLSLKQRYAR